MKTGQTVKIKKNAGGLWSEMFVGQSGVVEKKCGLYKGAWVVRFEDGRAASFYKDEVVKTK